MIRIEIEYKRKPSCVFCLDERWWLDSLANMIASGLFANAVGIWAHGAPDQFGGLKLWRCDLPTKV